MANTNALMSTSALQQTIDPGIRKHLLDTYKQYPKVVEKIFNVSEQQDRNEVHQSYNRPGILPTVAEGTNYSSQTILETYSTTYQPVKRGSLMTITDEEVRYDKSGAANAKKVAEMQAKQIVETIETVGANVFNNGFNTSYTSLSDNKPIFSTDHTSAGGYSSGINASTTSAPLSAEALKDAMTTISKTRDDNNNHVFLKPNTIVVPAALEYLAIQITKSEKQDDVANNANNPFSLKMYRGGILDIIVWDFLTSDTAWFVLDNNNHKLNWLWGVKPQVAKEDTSIGFTNDTMVWKVRYEASVGWDAWQGLYGSKGDGTAYSS